MRSHKYISRTRKGNRWNYVYPREPGTKTINTDPKTFVDKLYNRAVLGNFDINKEQDRLKAKTGYSYADSKRSTPVSSITKHKP